MKKILALLLAMVMLLSFAACGEIEKTEDPTKAPTEAPTEPEETPTEPAKEVKPVVSIIMNLNSASLYAEDLGDGTVVFSYVTETGYQAGMLDTSVMAIISEALAATEYEALELPEVEEDWMGAASLMVSFGEEDFFSYELYHSEIPEDFQAVYTAMEACFAELAKLLPEPEVQVEGEIAENDRAAIDGILENLELWTSADQFMIQSVPASDEAFAWVVGLPSADGVVSGLKFGSLNMSVPYSLQLVTAEDAAAIAKVYEENIDWRVFGCVFPTHALIATKDNQALLLLAADDEFVQAYSLTAAAIEAAGWTVYSVTENPDF